MLRQNNISTITAQLYQKLIWYINRTSNDMEPMLVVMLQTICKSLGYHGAIIWLREENNTLDSVVEWLIPSFKNNPLIGGTTKHTFNMDYSPTVLKKAVVISKLTAHEQGTRLQNLYSAGVRSYAAFPLITKGNNMGVVEFFAKKEDTFERNSEFYELNKNLAGMIAQYIKRKLKIKQLLLNEEKYRTLVELAPDIIYVIDKNNNVMTLNNAIEKITGYDKEVFCGESLAKFFTEDERELTMTKLLQARASKNRLPVQTKLVSKYPSDIYAEILESKEVKENRRIIRYGIIRDITQRHMLERQKEVWVAMATHELKTPLTSIKAFAQIVKGRTNNSENIKYLAKIDSMANSMTSIIDDFLEVTSFKLNGTKLQKSKFHINEIVEDIIYTLKPSVEHELMFELKNDVEIFADKKRVRQVLYNLIMNAVKYSPAKKGIIIKVASDKTSVTISVKDFGIGISSKDIKMLFKLFYRATTNRGPSGLGLGLFIAQSIVKAHKGMIWVESEEGKGSTFFVKLPI